MLQTVFEDGPVQRVETTASAEKAASKTFGPKRELYTKCDTESERRAFVKAVNAIVHRHVQQGIGFASPKASTSYSGNGSKWDCREA